MPEPLEQTYRAYLAALNEHRFEDLSRYVQDEVVHNDRRMSCAEYAAERAAEVRAIPDLRYDIDFVLVDGDRLAARLLFECSPAGVFRGIPVGGRTVSFCEHVFYRFSEGRIEQVWSVVDADAIRTQLGTEGRPR